MLYNASNNELVRTKTLVKNCIVSVDATPFRQWFERYYATPLGRKKGAKLVRCNLLFCVVTSSFTSVDVVINFPFANLGVGIFLVGVSNVHPLFETALGACNSGVFSIL